MAGTRSSKKRRKANASSSSSVSSSPAQPSCNQRNKKIISLVNDSKDEPTPTTIDNPADSTQPAKLQEMTDEQELSLKVHKAAISSTYSAYDPPQLSDQLDKHGRRMIAYPCKMQVFIPRCGNKIHRPTYNTFPINLSKNVASCTKKVNDSKSQKLAEVGVTGTGDVEVREAHWGALHPIVARNLPPRKAISADILRLYTAVQELLMESLKRHQGAMYLGLNVWQSPNGFDILGTVIYRLVEQPGSGGEFELEAMPLDFVHLQQSHTGVYLAKTVQLIVDKFGVKNKICGIITDNASNNQTMINKISSYKWPRFHGEPQWIRCFAHILNLIAQSILRPFGCHKKKANSNYDDKSNGSISETEEVDDQIQLMLKDNVNSDDEGEDSQEEDDLAQGFAKDDNIELEDNNVNDLSGEDEGDP
ncbi:hypothetical protein PCANC_06167 [Puccinia coronata f. sp. avenae]|uniref:DUF659 domain-containing protein n=1 Tax=Puccinia coronata f. sp. avenae TaxID=200324 RepID=A0A2N5VTH7_9BASI|nr:hypothetical protein PCANC_06167 [Puccinia coronata f. sp. avenae]